MNTETERNKELFETMPVPRAVAAMAVPTIIGQLIILIYNMADTFFIGRTDNPLMVAGVSLILPIFNVSIAFANIAGAGGGTLMARLMGRKMTKEARDVASFSMLFSILAGAAFSIFTACFMEPLLTLLGADSETFAYASTYVSCVIVAGAVPTVLSMTLSTLLRNTGRSKEAGFGVSMGGVINILLDPLFMFVLLPRGNEVLGAGVATALSNFIVCVYFLRVIRRERSEILVFPPRPARLEGRLVRSFFAVGLPAAMGPFLFDLDYMVLNRLMSGHGNIALAAIGIVLKVERLPLNTGIGLCLGMVPLASYNYTAGNRERMESVLRFTRSTGVVVSIVSILLYEIFAPQFIRLFIADSGTVLYGAQFLRIRAIATILMFLSFIYVHFFQAVGRGDYALWLVVMRWLLINIPMLFLLDRLFGMYGLAWSQFVSDALVALFSYLTYRRFYRAELKTGD